MGKPRSYGTARALFGAIALLACGKEPVPASATPPHATSSGTRDTYAAADDAGALADADADAGAPLAWAEAIRVERWDEAWRGLESLTEREKSAPEVKYARGRVALARRDYAVAAQLLDGLEASLPLLSDDIARHRAEARLEAGPFDAAGEYFATHSSPASQLKAARAFLKADATGPAPARSTPFALRARAAADRVILHPKRTHRDEAEARAIRAKLLEKAETPSRGTTTSDSAIAADARWICVHAPDTPFDKEAEATLTKTDPGHPLTADELMTRGRVLAEAGRTNEALTAFERAGRATGRPVPPLERLRARADALFKSHGRYVEASAAFAKAAREGTLHAPEDAFMAARALARADRDDEAIRDYEALEKKYPRTSWAGEACFHAARLHLLHGKWRDAANGFDAYLRKYPSGAERREATRSAAIAHLMAGEAKAARRLFGQVEADEDGLGSARAGTMEALAAAKDGDRLHAIARWTEIARARPLSWPALVARARLSEIGAPLPPPIEPADTSPAPAPIKLELPPPVDVLHRIGLDADAEDELREREALVTQAAPGRATEALCAAYGLLGRARRRYQIALGIPNTMLAQAPGPKTRWAWECAYPMPYESSVRAHEAQDRLPEGLVFAVMRQESNFDPEAMSPARAVGLMQLLPETAKAVADGAELAHEDAHLTSPPYNIALGSRYLRDLLGKFRGTIPLAVGGYNGGPDAIARWASRSPGMDLDVFVERIPFVETRIYVGRVMGNLARYGYLRNGEAGVPTIALALPAF